MKNFVSTSLLCLGLTLSSSAFAENKVKTIDAVYYNEDQTANYLTTGDCYLDNWGDFDIQSRIRRKNVSPDSVKLFVKSQVRYLSPQATDRLQGCVDNLNKTIKTNGYNLPIPAKVPFMATSMAEEGSAAAYTRKCGIVVNNRAIYGFGNLNELVAHELFHVLTRNDPKFKAKMYKLIGFKTLKKDIQVPESFKNMMISNPDVDHHNSYATFKINGKKVDCAMYIYSDEEWKGGTFFSYMKTGLVEIDKKKCTLVLKDGKPVIHSISDAEDFYDKVGRETDYVIDPEEILADNFSYVLCGSTHSDLAKAIQKAISK